MALKVCSNNHLTGYRTCPMCGSTSSRPIKGLGRVITSTAALHDRIGLHSDTSRFTSAMIGRSPTATRLVTPTGRTVTKSTMAMEMDLPSRRTSRAINNELWNPLAVDLSSLEARCLAHIVCTPPPLPPTFFTVTRDGFYLVGKENGDAKRVYLKVGDRVDLRATSVMAAD